jgi:hypothetical protein
LGILFTSRNLNYSALLTIAIIDRGACAKRPMADLLAAGERLNAAKIKTEFARRNNRAFGDRLDAFRPTLHLGMLVIPAVFAQA